MFFVPGGPVHTIKTFALHTSFCWYEAVNCIGSSRENAEE